MKRMLMIVGAVCSLLFLTGTVSAVEYKWDGSQFVEVGGTAPSASQLVTIPPGYHAHTRTDGTVIVHSDKNVGNAAAHEGVERPWPKTGFPGQTVVVGSTAVLAADPCPNGVCPVNRRVTYASTTTDSVKTSHVETVSSSRKGPLRQIAENSRNRREQRQSNRQSRGAGGCPCR